ncbi:uncharacterized protein LOC144617711 isoform X2 [Crassostrea virginica]
MHIMEALTCGFCHIGTEVVSYCGKLHHDNKETAAHLKCMKCSICKNDKTRQGKWMGATSGCELSKCRKSFHFYCAKFDDVAITKRLKDTSGKILYRVFCKKEHYEEYRMKNEDHQLTNNSSDKEAESGEEEHYKHSSNRSLNTEEEENEDILYKSDVEEDADNVYFDHNLNNRNCIKRKSENVGKMFDHKNKSKKEGESADRIPEKMSLIETGRTKNTLSRVKQNDQGEEDTEILEISSDEGEDNYDDSDYQFPTDLSVSELENECDMTSRKLNVKRVNQTFNRSETRNCRKAKQDTASKISNRRSNAMLMSKDHAETDGKQCYNTAEVHDATFRFTAQRKPIHDDNTTNGQAYISDDEMAMETNGSSKTYVLQQESDQTSPDHLPEMSSEWEEMIQFPACAVAIRSTTMVTPSKRNMIIQRAKERFDVNHVAIWTPEADSFLDKSTNDYLLHLMRIIKNMVRERNFKELGRLLTDISCKHCNMKYKYIVHRSDKTSDIRKVSSEEFDREEINGDEVLFMDTKINTLFLKLNDTVDRVCKIRNKLLPHAKERLGHLFEWKESTVSCVPFSQSDAEMEWKAINNWMTHQQWNLSEFSIYPSDDIFLAAKKNQGIEELMSHQFPKGKNKQKVIFVRAMKDIVNYNMFMKELILSCVETDDTLIICHSVPVITRQSLVPVDLPKERQVQVMSAFKPSNKRGISILVIHICNQKQQKLTTGHGHLSRSAEEITDIMPVLNRKRKDAEDNSNTYPQKQKRNR